MAPEEIRLHLEQVHGVVAVHDMHVWSLAPNKVACTVHVIVDQQMVTQRDRILSQCQTVLCIKHRIHHSTIQIETDAGLSQHCRLNPCT